MERGPPNVTLSLTPEYRSDNLTQNSTGGSSSGSLDWLEIPSLLIALLGLVGNGAVLWLLGFRISRNHFSVYILNLAAADALFLCFSFLRSILKLSRVFDLTRKILSNFKYISYAAGLSLLAAISTERCLSALFPLWHRCHRPKHMSAAVCAVLWALAGMFGLLALVLWDSFDHNFFPIFTILGSWLLLLTCVLCVSSLTLLLRVQGISRHRRPPRLYLLVLLTVLVFLLCGLPWGVGAVLRIRLKIFLVSYWLCDLLACVNSSVNPLIYFFVGRLGNRRREPLRVVLQRALGEEQELGDETTNTPHIPRQETSF